MLKLLYCCSIVAVIKKYSDLISSDLGLDKE